MKQLLCFIIIFFTITSCNGWRTKAIEDDMEGTLIIFHAGSLAMPFKAIADTFMKMYPGVKVLREASGSIDAARKITELKRECDIMASADYKIIDKLLIPEYASENIHFAANQLAIVYTSASRFSETINADNWMQILSRSDVYTGRSDPDADPCGYRTLMSLQLASDYYQKRGADSAAIYAEKIIEKDRRFIRPKEVDLLALLETGAVDYIFLYQSVAVQHRLPFLELPQEINMSNPLLNHYYSLSQVEVRGANPAHRIRIQGEAMIYGVTVLNGAPNKKAAEKFVEFLIDKNGGQKILEEMGQRPLFGN